MFWKNLNLSKVIKMCESTPNCVECAFYTKQGCGFQNLAPCEWPVELLDNNIPGTSKLIRSNDAGIIKIVYRRAAIEKDYRDAVCIDNNKREEFFADVKKSKQFNRDTPVYVITTADPELYLKWSTFINDAVGV